MESRLTFNQKKHYNKTIIYDGKEAYLVATVRYDDNLDTGENSFAITGEIYSDAIGRSNRYFLAGGCLHEVIAEHLPELRHLIKWHGSYSNRIWQYPDTVLFHAKDRTHEGKEIGEAVRWETRLKFDKYPFTFKENAKGFWDFLDNIKDFNTLAIVEVEHKDKGKEHEYQFNDNYSFEGLELHKRHEWSNAPFHNLRDAEEFLAALRDSPFSYVKTPTVWCEAIEPNLKAAQDTALWPDATLEQLQDKELLMSRLPQLLEEMRKDIEDFGFIY